MIGTTDTYYLRPEVSNSDLGMLQAYFMNKEQLYDIQQAYRFGNLIDAMITEPNRCDHLRYRVDGEQFSAQEWQTARLMLEAFRKDALCALMLRQSGGQVVKDKMMQLTYSGVYFELPARCKYDLWMQELHYGADIKSTVCTTQKQFEESITYFNYDRQAAWYMDISGADKHMFIGISKKSPYKIFKLPVTRHGDMYETGRLKYEELAFKYWCLFEGF